ncbi:hypothetical protein [Sphaerochaeta globosa]|uniref:Uncharacterized protein n=1 Tax=Sphaerochaeta globosa (strain ATCC BAA-1886 / DSM 22777 / Buddy) TaxID=158189 RepID=F0RZ57_SPHGB|nr:hypothetical protein [Sphaerochaeta globosa]ADY13338.1 hypothetical protein SpiBuddy_1513 [Sphaerochaeta globosa str. Buddy]
MQYTLMYIQKGHRITETYEVEGVTYYAELNVLNQGFALGMAGYDPIAVDISLTNERNPTTIEHFSAVFPKIKASECTCEDRYLVKDKKDADLYRFTSKGEQAIEQAILQYLNEVLLYQTINRKPNRYVAHINQV